MITFQNGVTFKGKSIVRLFTGPAFLPIPTEDWGQIVGPVDSTDDYGLLSDPAAPTPIDNGSPQGPFYGQPVGSNPGGDGGTGVTPPPAPTRVVYETFLGTESRPSYGGVSINSSRKVQWTWTVPTDPEWTFNGTTRSSQVGEGQIIQQGFVGDNVAFGITQPQDYDRHDAHTTITAYDSVFDETTTFEGYIYVERLG